MSISVPVFSGSSVLVVGDVMLDHYWHGNASRISPEAPVPVVHVQGVEKRPGGAANVAVNVSALGARPTLIGVCGEDDAGAQLTRLLEAAAVEPQLIVESGLETITKMRVLSRHQQLIRLDIEGPLTLGAERVARRFERCLPTTEVVILSDYAKGTLADPAALIARARAAGVPVLVDPKGRDFSRYRGATLITPNLAEFEAVAGPCADVAELESKARGLLTELALEALLVTRSEHGMSLLRRDQPPLHLPARAREVFDVTGAGDTVIATLATALAAGATLTDATTLANLAAGIVVGKLG
ncbi:MAG: D-glycero-beta-D-manno-heptose-7-phosphate kinase, partial [Gammaproteobacteria bacterium]|nr:D-glycero-beta-D-manno-heptose-7-phosphate kinase [Gammaproteobacteria bacterium]